MTKGRTQGNGKPYPLGPARCHQDANGLILLIAVEAEGNHRSAWRWIPLEAIHETSEVKASGMSGELVIIDGHWWTKHAGYCD